MTTNEKTALVRAGYAYTSDSPVPDHVRTVREDAFDAWLAQVKADVWHEAADFVDEQREDFDGDLRQVRDRMHLRAKEIG